MRLLSPKALGVACANLLLACLSLWHCGPHAATMGEAGTLISEFSLIVPNSPIDCERDNPWHNGRWPLATGGSVPSGGCLVLRYVLAQDAFALLLHQGPDGVLVRLAPSHCALHSASAQSAGAQYFPKSLEGRERVIELDQLVGEEQFHLLVFEQGPAVPSLLQQLTTLRTLASDCEASAVVGPTIAQVRDLVNASAVQVQWHTRVIDHY